MTAVFLAAPSANAQCLVGGEIRACDDLTRGATLARRTGGAFVADGFRIDRDTDHLTYDLGRTTDTGSLRVAVRQVSPATLPGDHHFVAVLSDEDGASLARTARRNVELFIYGATWSPPAPDLAGRIMFEAYDTHVPAGVSDRAPVSSRTWNAAATYVLEVRWSPAQVSLLRDGVTLSTLDTFDSSTSTRVPVAVRYVHVPMDPLRIPGFGPVIGSVISSVTFQASTASMLTDAGASDIGTDVASDVGRDVATSDVSGDVVLRDVGERDVVRDDRSYADAGGTRADVSHEAATRHRVPEVLPDGCVCRARAFGRSGGGGRSWAWLVTIGVLLAGHAGRRRRHWPGVPRRDRVH